MSKEVLFAGILGIVCVILVLVAFLFPKHAPVTPKPEEVASSDTLNPESDSTASSTAGTATAATTTTGTFTGQTAGSATGSSTTPSLDAGPIAPTSPGTATFTTGGTTTYAGTTGGSSFPASNGTFAGGGTAAGTGGYIPPANQYQPAPVLSTPQPGADGDSSTEKVHIVAANETLGEISQQYYNTHRYWRKIVAANPGLDPNALKVGQKITIPAISQAPTSADAPTSAASSSDGGADTYTVQKDDSYYKIAEKALGKASRWKEIEKLNNVAPEDLRVGQKLKLPPRESASEEPSSSHGDAGGSGSGGKVHIVAANETLGEISKQYFGTTRKWKDIVKANPGIDPESLRVGQKLNIPDGGESSGGTAPGAMGGASTDAGGGGEEHEYTVQPNDTIKIIAKKELGSSKAWTRIESANPGVDPKHLRVGQKLKIPGAEGGSSAPAPTTGFPSTPFGQSSSPSQGFAAPAPAPTSSTFGTPGAGTQASGGFAPQTPAPTTSSFGPGAASSAPSGAFPSSASPAPSPAPVATAPSAPAAPSGVSP